MRPALFIFLLFLSHHTYSQNIHVDSLNGFKIQMPAWLQLNETDKNNVFSGTLPETEDGIRDSIIITAFPRSAFSSFEDFKKTYLTGNKFGKPTLFSNDHVWYGQKELVKIPNGVAQKVFLHWKNSIYNEKFILLVAKRTYLWIRFIATPGSYDFNIGKFEEFMSGFKLIDP